jgi:hypothetical protein
MHVEQNGKVCWDACSSLVASRRDGLSSRYGRLDSLSTESLLLSVRTLIAADLAVIEQLLFAVIILSGQQKCLKCAVKNLPRIPLYTESPLIIKLAPVMVSRFELAK